MAIPHIEEACSRARTRERDIEIMTESETMQRQRAAALKTVWLLAGIALLVYVGFIASGVLAR